MTGRNDISDGKDSYGTRTLLGLVLGSMVVLALLVALSGCGGDGPDLTYGARFQEFDSQTEQALVVPVVPPAGYSLAPFLDARNWVPTGFENGRVPTVTLCVLDEGIDPAGVCFGTDDMDRVAVEESVVDGHRLVLVAAPGDGFTAEEMLADWHGLAFTATWRDLGWLSERSDTGR